VGPRAVLDAMVKRKIPSPRRESNPRTPIVQPVAQRYTDCAITTILLLLLLLLLIIIIIIIIIIIKAEGKLL
jgi:lipopolysaccharide/colanic/teichoic acid biosynthesis glycosyltransferase